VDAKTYKIKMANATASKGKPLNDITCYKLTHKNDKPCDKEHVCPLMEVKHSGKPVTTEHIHYDSDGDPRNKEVHGYPLFDEEGNVTEMIEYSIDITDKKKSEEKIKNKNDELESVNQKLVDSNSLKDMFMDIMRHDILNPLTVIQLNTEILEDTAADKKILSAISRSAKGAIEIIDNAKEYAKIDDTTQSFKMEEVDIQNIMSYVVDQISDRYKKAGVELINKLNKKIMLSLSPLISEVFLNFLTNALKYASKGKKVIIDTEKKGPYLLVKVIDFGEGIPDEYKETIFNRFSRKEKQGVKGTGLGLSIVSKIVKLHNGEVWVENNPKGGSVFIVSLPINTTSKPTNTASERLNNKK